MPLVSIITPVYNAARWLPETLESVRAQTLSDWEHLLVDDGSTDGSVALIEAAAAADSRIRLLRTPRNSGPAAARNLALDAAGSRYLAFLDADDLWLPHKLELCVKWMQRYQDYFIYHDYRQMSQDGSRLGALVTGPDKLNFLTLHTRRGHCGCLSVMIDRHRIAHVRFPAGSRHRHEDFCTWLSILQQGFVGRRIPFDLARYRLAEASRNANKLSAVWHTWRIYRSVSSLPFARAAAWWFEYLWNTSRMYRYAQPR